MIHKFQQVVTNKPPKTLSIPKAVVQVPRVPTPEPSPEKIADNPPVEEVVQSTPPELQEPLEQSGTRIFRLGDEHIGRRIEMSSIGIDIGTKNVILAFRDEDKPGFLAEINGYYVFPKVTPFIKKMLSAKHKRKDGRERAAKWIELEGKQGIFVLGMDAEELAYANNDTLQRPMAKGGIASDDEAMMILASIVQGLLEMAEKEVGKFSKVVDICYCTTADAINDEQDVEYHQRVVDLIIDGYETKAELRTHPIKESHAIVLKEDQNNTGIGISWGAGTVTVSYVKWGTEIYSFCWVGAGDWIDTEVAKRHGYKEGMRRKSAETPTTICRVKEKIDLTPGNEPVGDRLGLDILLHYQMLISSVIDGVVSGFVENENEARIDEAINIYMAGGTSSPDGFESRVEEAFNQLALDETLPFEIAKIHKADNPLFAVAEGCLCYAEDMQE